MLSLRLTAASRRHINPAATRVLANTPTHILRKLSPAVTTPARLHPRRNMSANKSESEWRAVLSPEQVRFAV